MTYFYYDKLLKYKQVDITVERELLKKAQNGCLDSQDKLVLANMRGIASICKCYANVIVSKQELYGVAVCAFIETIKEFDPKKYDVRLITFARKKIHGEICGSNESSKGLIALPYHLKQIIYHIENIVSELNIEEFTEKELICHIADKLNENVKTIEKVFYKYIDLNNHVFLDYDFVNCQQTFSTQQLPDNSSIFCGKIEAEVDLKKLMTCLNDNEKEIVLRRWNILPYETVAKMSNRWGITPQAVSLRYVRAMKKLKNQLEHFSQKETLTLKKK